MQATEIYGLFVLAVAAVLAAIWINHRAYLLIRKGIETLRTENMEKEKQEELWKIGKDLESIYRSREIHTKGFNVFLNYLLNDSELRIDFSTWSSDIKVDAISAVVNYGCTVSGDEFGRELYGRTWQDPYVQEKHRVMKRDFTSFWCGLDLDHRLRFLQLALQNTKREM